MVRIFFLPYLGNRSKSDPCSFELFCLKSHISSFPKVLRIPPESPCICTKKGVTRVLSVFRWDVSCGEFLGIIQSQVVPWTGGFIIRVLVNSDDNLTH